MSSWRLPRPLAGRVAAVVGLAVVGCDLPTALPCFTCPEAEQLTVVGDSVAVLGDTVRLRAVAVGTAMAIFLTERPVADASWQLSDSPPGRLLITSARTRDTAAVGTARLLPGQAGDYTVAVRWRNQVTRHLVLVRAR